MSNGGGDGGYAKKQAEIEAKKQQARDQLNMLFGVAPTSVPEVQMPDERKFVRGSGGEWKSGDNFSESAMSSFDQAGYDAAVAEAKRQQEQAGAAARAQAEKNMFARDQLYGQVRDNAFNAGKRRIDEQKEAAQRNLRFSLFAQGLAGGSEDVNQNALLGRTYDQGILDLGAKADATKADMRSSDEQTRLGLLQSIDAGMDQGSAISSALSQLKVNADRSAAAAQGTSLGDLFAGAGLLYHNSQAAKGKQAAQDWWNTYQPSGQRAKGNATGTISNV